VQWRFCNKHLFETPPTLWHSLTCLFLRRKIRAAPLGELTTVFINLSDILGLAFDKKGRLYVLENTTGNQFPTPGTGKILRVDGKNNYTEIATGLSLPTAMTFGPDGNLYVSNLGFGPPPVGAGQVLKVIVPAD
jgi:hypothetical protein